MTINSAQMSSRYCVHLSPPSSYQPTEEAPQKLSIDPYTPHTAHQTTIFTV